MQRKMNRTTQMVLIIVGSVLLLCVCASGAAIATGLWSVNRFVGWTEENTSEDPQVAVRFGSEIAEFDVPGGFGSPYGVHIGDLTLIRYTSQSDQSYFLLAQFPEETSIDLEGILELLEDGSKDPNSVWYSTETTIIEQKPVTIRGQAAILNISEGTTSEGEVYRNAAATFEGRGGSAVVVVAGPVAEWDLEMVENFIASIQ